MFYSLNAYIDETESQCIVFDMKYMLDFGFFKKSQILFNFFRIIITDIFRYSQLTFQVPYMIFRKGVMQWKLFQILAMILFFNMPIIANQYCLRRQVKIKSIIRGNYKNVLHIQNGALISSKSSNKFYGGNNGICLKDAAYITSIYQWCQQGYSIVLVFLQKYELNTLKIWFWDGDNRIYRIKIYTQLESQETQIYDGFTKSVFTISFPDQVVSGVRILNVAGNTYNTHLHLIKIEASYKL
ncbi:unnamed protein product [Paramecium octaurelia]|uniref:Transmembrane protein n=1 Tax=Paramecium octaurelia TaxID=43137 RepID=A0A8S1YBN0_PAROT|nr:unnamed protein product [Paramecium octaurelia]